MSGNNTQVVESEISGVVLVRDCDGNPKFDDIDNIPDIVWETLTDKEKEVISNEHNAPQ